MSAKRDAAIFRRKKYRQELSESPHPGIDEFLLGRNKYRNRITIDYIYIYDIYTDP